MIDGTYKMQVNTPLGSKTGTVSIRTAGATAHADIDMPIIGKQQANGTVAGDTLTASGTFKMGLMGKVSYSLQGRVVGDELHIDIQSSKGNFAITGVRA